MKRLFVLFSMLVAVLAVNAVTYDITVKGVKVTDANKDDVLGDKTVKYDPNYNRLWLKDANITSTSECIKVGSNVPDLLVIECYGRNVLTSTSSHGITYGSKDGLVISGVDEESSLNINARSSGAMGIDLTNESVGDLQIQNINMTIDAGSTGIGSHLLPQNHTLEIFRSTINVEGEKSALKLNRMTMVGCHYASGYGVSGFNSEGRSLFNGSVTKNVKILHDVYDIYVNSSSNGVNYTERADARNCSDLGYSIGVVSYKASDYELTFKDSELTGHGRTIDFRQADTRPAGSGILKIKLVGKNKISGGDAAFNVMLANCDSVLIYSENEGSLELDSYFTEAAFNIAGPKKIAIRNCTVKINNTCPTGYIFKGRSSEKTKLSLVNANLTCTTAGYILSDIYDIECYGCYIQTPSDAFVSSSGMLASSGKLTSLVVVPGKDNVKPNFFYGSKMNVVGTPAKKTTVEFKMAMDNYTNYDKLKYHVYLAKDRLSGIWVQDYDLKNLSFGSNLLKTELNDLEPNTTYILRIKVTDSAGNYAIYDDLQFTTSANKAPTLPANHSLTTVVQPRNIQLSWKAATDDYTDSDKLIYVVEYKKLGASGWTMPNVGNATSYNIANLTPNTTYQIDVLVKDGTATGYKFVRYGEIQVTTPADADGIETVTTDADAPGKAYNMQGVKVDGGYKGIVIKNGRKYIVK